MTCARRLILSLLISATAVLAPATTASAQTTSPFISVAAKGGLTTSNLVYSEAGDFFKSGRGGAAGVAITVGRGGWLGLSVVTEVLFVQKKVVDAITNGRLKFDWLEVPIMAKVRAGSIGSARIFGVVGPAVDLRIGATFDDFDAADDYESLGLNLVAGGGVEFGRWSVEARGSWGFTNLPKVLSGETLKDRSVLILGGFRLR